MAGLGHIAVGLAAGRLYARGPEARAQFWFAALAMLPDLDVLGFRFGVPYGSTFGHRGASHALAVAVVAGTVFGFGAWLLRGRSLLRTSLFSIAVLASHGLLDAMTDGGRGIALLWPMTSARYFAPWTPIPVAPIGAGMLSARGFHVTLVELVEFSPLLLYALWPRRR